MVTIRFLITILDLHLQKMTIFTCILYFVKYFSCGKFEKILVTCNVQKPGLFIISFLKTEQKQKKKRKNNKKRNISQTFL